MIDNDYEGEYEGEYFDVQYWMFRAYSRLLRSYSRGTGCHLTIEMVKALGLKDEEIWTPFED